MNSECSQHRGTQIRKQWKTQRTEEDLHQNQSRGIVLDLEAKKYLLSKHEGGKKWSLNADTVWLHGYL
jgi:hypothetical protein